MLIQRQKLRVTLYLALYCSDCFVLSLFDFLMVWFPLLFVSTVLHRIISYYIIMCIFLFYCITLYYFIKTEFFLSGRGWYQRISSAPYADVVRMGKQNNRYPSDIQPLVFSSIFTILAEFHWLFRTDQYQTQCNLHQSQNAQKHVQHNMHRS